VSDQQAGEQCKRCGKGTLAAAKASEVGNIFDLGTRYTKAFEFKVKDSSGKDLYPIMGCFGIGTTRLVGVITEALSDDKGLVWPAAVAPFTAHLILIDGKDENIRKDADLLYETLKKQGIDVLYDDRADISAGEKFKDADLLGMPWRIVISARTIAAGQLECVKRKTGETFSVNEADLITTITAHE
jgi:prolyl-tRNA synthetase